MFNRLYLSPCKVGANAAGNYWSNLGSVHQVPITARWAEAVWNTKFVQHFYPWSVLRIEPQTFWFWVQCHVFSNCNPLFHDVSGLQELELREEVVALIAEHYSVVLWFYYAGLLPEHPEDDSTSEALYPFPTARLAEMYTKRRSEIEHLHRYVLLQWMRLLGMVKCVC